MHCVWCRSHVSSILILRIMWIVSVCDDDHFESARPGFCLWKNIVMNCIAKPWFFFPFGELHLIKPLHKLKRLSYKTNNRYNQHAYFGRANLSEVFPVFIHTKIESKNSGKWLRCKMHADTNWKRSNHPVT